jgi:hypothetical protein
MELALDVCPSVLLEHELNNNLEHELRTKVDERIPHHEPRSTAMAGEGHTGEIDPEGAVMNGSAASPDEDENPFCSDTGASRRKPGPNKTVKSQDAGNRNAQDRGHRLRFALTRSLDKNAPSSSSQNWMTSSIRVGPPFLAVTIGYSPYSCAQIILHLFYTPVANSRAHSNQTSKFTKSRWKSNTSIWPSLFSVAIYESRVFSRHRAIFIYILTILGLTDEHHVLTTYFEGELIGSKYTFQTKHEDWCANEKTDHHHWSRFPAYRPIQSQAKKPDFHYKNWAQREHIFMRWKEYFLVPDHRVREITGASFEGFYYICFNQVAGSVSGIYFHAKSEK